MFDWKYLVSALRVGLFLGLIFGVVNLMFSWLFPLLVTRKVCFFAPGAGVLRVGLIISSSAAAWTTVVGGGHGSDRGVPNDLRFRHPESAEVSPVLKRTDGSSRLAGHDAAFSRK